MKLMISEYLKWFRNALIFGLILVTIWAAILVFVPAGWWIVLVNVVFFVITGIIIGMASVKFFKRYMPAIPAYILSVVIWLIMAVFIRSLIAELLSMI